jgi:hypothetical protein
MFRRGLMLTMRLCLPDFMVDNRLLIPLINTVLSLGSWNQGFVRILAYMVESMPILPREVIPFERYVVMVKMLEALYG